MIVNENSDTKILEKFREMTEKESFRSGSSLSRSFTVPSQDDSEEVIDVTITISCRQTLVESSEAEVAVESVKARRGS